MARNRKIVCPTGGRFRRHRSMWSGTRKQARCPRWSNAQTLSSHGPGVTGSLPSGVSAPGGRAYPGVNAGFPPSRGTEPSSATGESEASTPCRRPVRMRSLRSGSDFVHHVARTISAGRDNHLSCHWVHSLAILGHRSPILLQRHGRRRNATVMAIHYVLFDRLPRPRAGTAPCPASASKQDRSRSPAQRWPSSPRRNRLPVSDQEVRGA